MVVAPSLTSAHMTQLIMPQHANSLGITFGGDPLRTPQNTTRLRLAKSCGEGSNMRRRPAPHPPWCHSQWCRTSRQQDSLWAHRHRSGKHAVCQLCVKYVSIERPKPQAR